MSELELAAYRAYQVFIRNAVGTRMYLRGENGQILKDEDGRPLEEDFETASRRRWERAPQSTRDEFFNYAKAMEPVFRASHSGAFT